jgi:DNA polymerase III alpha subunit
MNDIKTFSTTLNGRVLCGDGDSIVELPFLYDHLLNGGLASDVFISKEDFNSSEIERYNDKFSEDKVNYKKEMNETCLDWDIPKRYKELDVYSYILNGLKKEVRDCDFSDEEIRQRFYRVKMELRIWKKRNLLDMLRTLIFIVNTLEERKIIWGTGRGSSCASYILYLIGLHQVDSVEYELDLGEFFR